MKLKECPSCKEMRHNLITLYMNKKPAGHICKYCFNSALAKIRMERGMDFFSQKLEDFTSHIRGF